MPPGIRQSPPPWRLVLLVAGVAAYAAAVYWTSRRPSGLTVLLAAFPFVWFAGVGAGQVLDARQGLARRTVALLPLALVLAALALSWNHLLANFRLLYLVDHVGVHAGLCWLFSRSLLPARTPLCTEMAGWVHEDMNCPRLLRYTRQVTLVWAVFFGSLAFASIMVYVVCAPATWTLFSALLCPMLTGAVFLIENAARSLFLPPKDRVGLAGTWQAVRARLDAQSGARASGRPR
ncbi:MAG: hypothetical protein QM772_01015 [Ottowia sp.]|uniref:hypothetical protein n=1 Tax=Ottowia sp. TaxID=1898956 RepID=UPI0039E38136